MVVKEEKRGGQENTIDIPNVDGDVENGGHGRLQQR